MSVLRFHHICIRVFSRRAKLCSLHRHQVYALNTLPFSRQVTLVSIAPDLHIHSIGLISEKRVVEKL